RALHRPARSHAIQRSAGAVGGLLRLPLQTPRRPRHPGSGVEHARPARPDRQTADLARATRQARFRLAAHAGPVDARRDRVRRAAGLLSAVSRYSRACPSQGLRGRRTRCPRRGKPGLVSEDMRFGLFIPQGWRLDLVDIPTASQWEVMSELATYAD